MSRYKSHSLCLTPGSNSTVPRSRLPLLDLSHQTLAAGSSWPSNANAASTAASGATPSAATALAFQHTLPTPPSDLGDGYKPSGLTPAASFSQFSAPSTDSLGSKPANMSLADPAAMSLCARRPNATNLGSMALPPLAYADSRKQIPITSTVSGTATHLNAGNLLTPPANASADTLTPISAIVHDANAVARTSMAESCIPNSTSWQKDILSPSILSNAPSTFNSFSSTSNGESLDPSRLTGAALTSPPLSGMPQTFSDPSSYPNPAYVSPGSDKATAHSRAPSSSYGGYRPNNANSAYMQQAGGLNNVAMMAVPMVSTGYSSSSTPAANMYFPAPATPNPLSMLHARAGSQSYGMTAGMPAVNGYAISPSTGYGMGYGMAAPDRPFKCDQCPQSFNRNHDLKRHKRIHLAVKPFPCGYCDKSFSRKDALKVGFVSWSDRRLTKVETYLGQRLWQRLAEARVGRRR